MVLISLVASPLAANDDENGQLTRTEFKDKWGQVLFCQKMYTMPEVRSRLYDFDTEQCDAAAKLAEDLVSVFPPNEQQWLKQQAEKHANALSYNATEPYHAVPACREYCSKLAELKPENIGVSSNE